MTQRINQFGQPIGAALPDWQPVAVPESHTLTGRYCRLEPLDAARDAQALYAAYSSAPDGRDWTYLTEERPNTLDDFAVWLTQRAAEKSFVTFTVICAQRNIPVGLVSYMRIDPVNGSLEIGGVTWSPWMQRSVIGTEALWLMMKQTFDLGYRRCEWKCDSLNGPSRNAALRLGFTYEGTFRQMMARKGRSRDSDWFSIIDSEWPAIDTVLSDWLSPQNLDAQGEQRASLSQLMRARKRAESDHAAVR